MKKNLKGFTLVEVLIVIIIVGILIAALLPRLVGTQARARNTARAAHINQIASAVALYVVDNPGSGAVLSGCSNTTELDSYLASRPLDPSGAIVADSGCTGGTYPIYRTAGAGGEHWVCASAENAGGDYAAIGSAATAVLTPPAPGTALICNVVRG